MILVSPLTHNRTYSQVLWIRGQITLGAIILYLRPQVAWRLTYVQLWVQLAQNKVGEESGLH